MQKLLTFNQIRHHMTTQTFQSPTTASIKNILPASFARLGTSAKWCGLFLYLLLAGCAVPHLQEDISTLPVQWEDLPGWDADQHAKAVPAFLRGCEKIADNPPWRDICAAAAKLPDNVSDEQARQFFEQHFTPHKLLTAEGGDTGLITGYYETLLYGAREPSSRYRYPIYTRPNNMLKIELGELYPALKKRRVRGRLVADNTVHPYYSRAEIDGAAQPLAGNELLWVDDRAALFFLHVNGSGLVQLPDDKIIGVGYADQNGHPYRSIGKLLAEWGEIPLPDINLFSIRQWLDDNPARMDELLNANPSYIFFIEREASPIGPTGSLNVPLTPRRSLAIDPTVVFLGSPMWLDAESPDGGAPLRRLMIAQDTGGVIKGRVRADFFWGRGEQAKKMAGLMKSRGHLYTLQPQQNQ